MIRISSTLRNAVLSAMIPLALFAGLQLPECECANGERRILCPHALGVRKSHADVAAKSCCDRPARSCCRKEASRDSERPASQSPCDACKIITAKPFTSSVTVAAPAPVESWLFLADVDGAAILCSTTLRGCNLRHTHDVGPPDDLIVVFRCLLI